MSNCYMCDSPLTKENETEEHIFLNAIGGKLKPKTLICRKCNSDFGNNIDDALAEQFNHIANMLNIDRDRGEPQPFNVTDEKTGETLSYQPGGKPKYLKPDIERNGNQYHIRASDLKQARQILNGLKRKHPEIDVEAILKDTQTERKYLDNQVHFAVSFGGDDAFRSICKTAINFYLYSDGSKNYIEHLLPYIKCEIAPKNIVSPIYLSQDPISKTDDDILHSIIVKGNPKENVLFAYVELFNFYKSIVLLNDNYEGPDMESSYFFDVLSREEVMREYTLELSKEEIVQKMEAPLPFEELGQHLTLLIRKIQEKQDSDHRSTLITTAINTFSKKYPEGAIIDEKMRNELVAETMKQVTPWILHNMKDKK